MSAGGIEPAIGTSFVLSNRSRRANGGRYVVMITLAVEAVSHATATVKFCWTGLPIIANVLVRSKSYNRRNDSSRIVSKPFEARWNGAAFRAVKIVAL